MTDYLIRTGKDGMVTDLLELDEEDECDCCQIDCDKCEQLEAAMLAIISSLREEIGMLKARVADLEKRPMLESEPLFPPWVVTCNTTSQIDPDMLSKTITNSIYKAMRT